MCIRATALAGLIAAMLAPAAAQQRVRDGVARLPDGEVTRSGAFTAYLAEPTTRYAHGVLGDAVEAARIVVEGGGRTRAYRLGEDAVFEDRRVRLADLDGDGRPEAIVVKSYLRRGAAIAAYRILPDRIVPLAESPALGTPNRWLNPVGVGDFTGGGAPAIAAVVTPHLAGSLRLYRLANGALTEVARIDGFTNHIIGRRDLDLGRVADIDGDGVADVVLPTLERRALAVIGFRGGKPAVIRRKPVPRPIVALAAIDGARATVTLDDGSIAVVDLAD